MVDESDLLADVGARAVNAASIERHVIQQANGSVFREHIGSENDPADLEEIQHQLRAVRREIRAVSLETSRLKEIWDGKNAGEGLEGEILGGSLQQAMLEQRLAGLESRQEDLVAALQSVGGTLKEGIEGHPQCSKKSQKMPERKIVDLVTNKGPQTSTSKRNYRKDEDGDAALVDADLFEEITAGDGASGGPSLVETERDRLIRIGILTPFDKIDGFERRVQSGGSISKPDADASIARVGEKVRQLRAEQHTTMLVPASELPYREKAPKRVDEGFWRASTSGFLAPPKKKAKRRKAKLLQTTIDARNRRSAIKKHSIETEGLLDIDGLVDDADDSDYDRRYQAACRQTERRSDGPGATQDENASQHSSDGFSNKAEDLSDLSEDENEFEQDAYPMDNETKDVIFEGGFRVPGKVYDRLFEYQRTAVKWMWELHTQRAGGIIADEMGLGKTIQIIAFLASLHHSGLFQPSLIVCPATVLNQWLREFRAWYPPFRVLILHESAGHSSRTGKRNASALVERATQSDAGILVTTYDQLRLKSSLLLPIRWGYVILDEGHKIRNPDADITLVAKQLATVHRIIMTGSPIQNKLTELWSLFDFVFPGKLGTLPVFQSQFSLPIQLGGYANASPVQVSAAYKCSVILRDLIAPYMLRRRKLDVASSLPRKTERVLFCSLCSEQRDLYRSYLSSKEMAEILAGKRGALAGIDILRKICNHPDLLERTRWEASQDYGNPARSGKLAVLKRLLEHWSSEKELELRHKVLIFAQTQQMLDIIEKMVVDVGWKYRRMDGGTSVAQRARIIDDFNTNPDVYLFLLTTRVGGLGVNLTAANRCIIFDPDWNPSTDVQARERAWRIGQLREVAVYRLITSGTIEEKVYHRQVYKHFLTDRVLQDPRQRRFFKARDLADLFTLGEEYAEGTETGEIFATLGTEVDVSYVPDDQERQSNELNDSVNEGLRSEDVATRSYGSLASSTSTDEQDGRRLPAEAKEFGETEKAISIRNETVVNNMKSNGKSAGDDGDAHILKDLLDGAGVHSALDHDRIEGAHRSDNAVAEREAAKIAAKAAEALKRSRRAVLSAPITEPTWTGLSGRAGAPRFGKTLNPRLGESINAGKSAGISKRNAPVKVSKKQTPTNGSSARLSSDRAAPLASSVLLARMRERSGGMPTAGSTDEFDPDVTRGRDIGSRVMQFLRSNGGCASSEDVAAAFQGEIGSGDAALFRGVLRQVATLQRRQLGGAGKSTWVLRPEFRSPM